MLAVTAGGFPAGHLGGHEGALFLPSRGSDPLNSDWQRHVLASSGYLELGMFDDAALALEEIEPEDKTRNEVLGARVDLYMAAKKWDMAAAVASHLVKVEPENAAWWINLAYAVRRSEGIEKAEAILLRARAIHPKDAMIAFNLACYASVTGRMEEAKARLRHAVKFDKDIRNWRSTMKICAVVGLDRWLEVVGRVFQAPVCSLTALGAINRGGLGEPPSYLGRPGGFPSLSA